VFHEVGLHRIVASRVYHEEVGSGNSCVGKVIDSYFTGEIDNPYVENVEYESYSSED
jgi:hypothetical protein